MTKGFGKTSTSMKANTLVDAAELIILSARRLGRPLIMAMHPPGNDHGLKSGEIQVSDTSELRPSCKGIVVAVYCSSEEAQEITDLITDWGRAKEGDRHE